MVKGDKDNIALTLEVAAAEQISFKQVSIPYRLFVAPELWCVKEDTIKIDSSISFLT